MTVLIYSVNKQKQRHSSSETDARFQSRAGRKPTVPICAKMGEFNLIAFRYVCCFSLAEYKSQKQQR